MNEQAFERVCQSLAQIFGLTPARVTSIIELFEAGDTVPFIARYRKEKTGGMDDQTLRAFESERQRLLVLEERKTAIIRLLTERELLNDTLRRDLNRATRLTELEDLYRPYKVKRQTRASQALALGLQPIADYLRQASATEDGLRRRATELLPHVRRQLADDTTSDELLSDKIIQGGADILAEKLADRSDVRSGLRQYLSTRLVLQTKAKDATQDSVYRLYYDYSERLDLIAAHRLLAVLRGEREKVLQMRLISPDEEIVGLLAKWFIPRGSKLYTRLYAVCEDSWQRLLEPSLTNEWLRVMTERAEDISIDLFAANLRSLLLQPPLKNLTILGWDPGYRHGCKCAIIDRQGELLETMIVYPFESKAKALDSERILHELITRYQVDLIAIGNGTAARESERFVADFIQNYQLACRWLIVSEAGASVYSASATAAEEFPNLDVTLRSAVSIARRVQDPLAELVKIEPRAIGVGQYQHDLNAKKLEAALAQVVETCVNEVGVDLNTASPHLLAYVSGLNLRVGREIVAARQKLTRFCSREQLREVRYLGPKTFEQAAGFLKISDAEEFLDRTRVHPESYELTRRIAGFLQTEIGEALGHRLSKEDLTQLARRFETDIFTLEDIRDSLLKPNLDPRDSLPQPQLKSDLLRPEDLDVGMILEGVVRNVAAFGAFVDLGLDHDGLVHLSKLATRYVKDPLEVVQVGQPVRVEVLAYDAERKRLSLSMKNIPQPQAKK